MSGDQPGHSASNNSSFEAFYNNGALEIVGVFHTEQNQQPLVKDEGNPQELPSLYAESDGAEKCLKLDPQSLNMQLDMFNFTLVKYDEDSEGTYRLVASGDAAAVGDDDDDAETVTCVLQTDEDNGSGLTSNNDTYVMMKSGDGETMYLRATVQAANEACTENNAGEVKNNAEGNENSALTEQETKSEMKKPSIEEILSNHKIVKRVRQEISKPIAYHQRGRKKYGTPSAKELPSTSTLKLYLYNCKHCSFKCNSTKELNVHRAQMHANAYKPPRSRALSKTFHNEDLYSCPACRYKTNVQSLLKQHIAEQHKTKIDDDVVILVNAFQEQKGMEVADCDKTYLQIEKDVNII